MALTDLNRQNNTVTQYSVKQESDLDNYKAAVDITPHSSAPRRAMPPDLKFQENSSLLQGEDVEVFFKNLEGSETESETHIKRESDLDSSSPKEMFQNSMHSMSVQGSVPTYHDSPGAITSMHSGSNPLYVPTTRAVLPPMHYMTNGSGQGASTPSSPAMWQLQPETTYSTTNPHSSVSPRFAFAPAPSSPISTPTGRTDSSFTSPIARSGSLNPYSYMSTPDLSPWNFQMALQQGLRQTGPGKSSFFSTLPIKILDSPLIIIRGCKLYFVYCFSSKQTGQILKRRSKSQRFAASLQALIFLPNTYFPASWL